MRKLTLGVIGLHAAIMLLQLSAAIQWPDASPYLIATLLLQLLLIVLHLISQRHTLSELARTAQQQAALTASQRELTRAVSHELKTPVARLRLGLEMAQMADDAEEQQKRFAGMDKDIHELETLIDEILLYARLDHAAPALNKRTIKLQAALADILNNLNLLHPQKQITWAPETDALLEVSAEPRYLARLLQNLLSNAARYARQRVQIHAECTPKGYMIAVDDDGPGIPADKLTEIFQTFVRLDQSRARESGGHGLGLAIAQRIAHWHGGQLTVSVSPLGGARFTFAWPSTPSR